MTSEENKERRNLSHNLAREWVTSYLASQGDINATVESEWFGEGIAFPQTAGEFQEPTGQVPPDWIRVVVAFPGNVHIERVEELANTLSQAIDEDPRMGGRMQSARLFSLEPFVIERIHPEGVTLSLQFSVTGPTSPSAN
jgi:hypothetical protein